MKPQKVKTTIEKLVFGGQGLSHIDGKVLFSWNALPDEVAEVEIQKKKKDFLEGRVINVVQPSKERIEPEEEHFLSCSPWQIMSLQYENSLKQEVARESFLRTAKISFPKLPITSLTDAYGYRNKMEYSFSFARDGKDQISLAFFERGKKFRFPIHGCKLAREEINNAAVGILEWINAWKVPLRSLKSLILRSNRQGEVIAALFIKDELHMPNFDIALVHGLVGFRVYFSSWKSPASNPDTLLFSIGSEEIQERLLNASFSYGALSFFQVHPEIFERALMRMKDFIPKNSDLLDYYGGVGSISIPFGAHIRSSVIIDSNEEAISYAEKNINTNKLHHFTSICKRSEDVLEAIEREKIMIVDPPREGLHQDVVKKVLEVMPIRVVYLSCNISTQARDLSLLSERYKVVNAELFNFFPRTPHIESLVVLDPLDNQGIVGI